MGVSIYLAQLLGLVVALGEGGLIDADGLYPEPYIRTSRSGRIEKGTKIPSCWS